LFDGHDVAVELADVGADEGVAFSELGKDVSWLSSFWEPWGGAEDILGLGDLASRKRILWSPLLTLLESEVDKLVYSRQLDRRELAQ
jgi:hypothetical protein